MSNGNLKLIGEKSKEMYPHLVPPSQVKRFLLKKKSCPTSPKYVETNAKVPKTFTKSTDAILSSSASGSPSTSKFVTCSTTITSPKNVETNVKVPNTATNPSASGSQSTSKFVAPSTALTSLKNVETNTATNSTIAILSPSASGSQSTSKFVTHSTTLTLPTGHHTQTNPIIDRTGHDMVTDPIATFSACLGELVHSSGPTVTLPTLHTVENMATVCTTSAINTNMYKHLQLSTAANTVEKSATGIPKSTLKLNPPLNIKLPTNIPPPAKKTILKAPNSIPLKKRVTFENLMATLPLDTTEKKVNQTRL